MNKKPFATVQISTDKTALTKEDFFEAVCHMVQPMVELTSQHLTHQGVSMNEDRKGALMGGMARAGLGCAMIAIQGFENRIDLSALYGMTGEEEFRRWLLKTGRVEASDPDNN